MTETRPLRVFLCHSSNDKPIVRDLYRRLEAEGWMDVWLDEEKLYPGQDWNFEIEKAVEDSQIVLVFLTNNSVSKEGYIQRELRHVLDVALNMPEETIFVIPLKLEDCTVPRRLQTWQWLNYFPESDRDRAYQRLLTSLKIRARKLGLPTENSVEAAKRHEAEEQEKKATEELEKANRLLKRKEIELGAVLAQASERIEYEKNKNIKIDEELEQKITQENVLKEPTQNRARLDVVEKNLNIVGDVISTKKTSSTNIISRPLLYVVLLAIISLVLGFSGKALIDMLSNVSLVSPTSTSTSTHTPVPTLGIDSTMVSPKDGMTLVYVPQGEFTMGSDNGEADEKPAHKVTLDAFWIDQTEVTNAMYAKCVKDGVCKEPMSASSNTHPRYYGNSEFDNYPVIYVDWNMANAYCSWAERRLPSETEWEKAARGKSANIYPWGNNAPSNDLLNYNNAVGDTTVVGAYPNGKSIYGALDMAGNVYEIVNDWFDVYPGGDPNASIYFGQQYRVTRGGSWDGNVNFIRSALRNILLPSGSSYYYSTLGFRCARSP